MRLDEITEPGVYACRRTGDLIRVVRPHVSSGEAELIERHSGQSIYVTPLSTDPFLPISRARQVAANLGLPVNF